MSYRESQISSTIWDSADMSFKTVDLSFKTVDMSFETVDMSFMRNDISFICQDISFLLSGHVFCNSRKFLIHSRQSLHEYCGHGNTFIVVTEVLILNHVFRHFFYIYCTTCCLSFCTTYIMSQKLIVAGSGDTGADLTPAQNIDHHLMMIWSCEFAACFSFRFSACLCFSLSTAQSIIQIRSYLLRRCAWLR